MKPALKLAERPLTQDQVALITRTVAKGATHDELALFLNVAKRAQLDPFTKQIHFVKRNVWNKDLGKAEEVGTIQVGIDGLRAIAERSGQLAGSDDPVYDSEDMDHPMKASVTVYKLISGTRCPFTASARWSEYAAIHPKTKETMGQWKKMPYLMLGKCAEALALRKAFPNDMSGLYTEEEMQQAGEVIDVPPAVAKSKKAEELEKLMKPSEEAKPEATQQATEAILTEEQEASIT